MNEAPNRSVEEFKAAAGAPAANAEKDVLPARKVKELADVPGG